MILITNIEFECCPADVARICTTSSSSFLNLDAEPASLLVETEIVRGRIFRRPDGTEINIGNSRQAADIIGIQYEEWKNQERMFDECINEKWALTRRLDRIKAARFRQRLKWLFKGVS